MEKFEMMGYMTKMIEMQNEGLEPQKSLPEVKSCPRSDSYTDISGQF